jgi:hypothetical protein
MLKLAQQVDHITSDVLLMTFHRFDESLQLSLFSSSSFIVEFINQLKIKKNSWFDMYQYYRHEFRPLDISAQQSSSSQLRTSSQQEYYKRSWQQKQIIEAHFAEEQYTYDSTEDAYFAINNDHSSDHIFRRMSNTHDDEDDQAFAHWSESINRCNQKKCTHYHWKHRERCRPFFEGGTCYDTISYVG